MVKSDKFKNIIIIILLSIIVLSIIGRITGISDGYYLPNNDSFIERNIEKKIQKFQNLQDDDIDNINLVKKQRDSIAFLVYATYERNGELEHYFSSYRHNPGTNMLNGREDRTTFKRKDSAFLENEIYVHSLGPILYGSVANLVYGINSGGYKKIVFKGMNGIFKEIEINDGMFMLVIDFDTQTYLVDEYYFSN